MIAALNDLDVQGFDIQIAYLNTDNRENFWFRDVPEFGELQGKNFIFNKLIYGINYTVSSFILEVGLNGLC